MINHLNLDSGLLSHRWTLGAKNNIFIVLTAHDGGLEISIDATTTFAELGRSMPTFFVVFPNVHAEQLVG